MNTEAPLAPPALLRLLQLTSPALPIGAYAYSQGLEHAVTVGWVHDAHTAERWILGILGEGLARLDLPVLLRLQRAWLEDDEDALQQWAAFLRGCREAAELQEEDRQLGQALARLLRDLDVGAAAAWTHHRHAGLAVLFALAAARWSIPPIVAAHGYVWVWVEHQVAAAVKLIPLGQTAGQRLLSRAAALIPAAVAEAVALDDDDIGFAAPALAIGSALHETQYSRLFRS